MKKIFQFVLFFLIISCSKDDDPAPTQQSNPQPIYPVQVVVPNPNIVYSINCSFGGGSQGIGLTEPTLNAVQGIQSICSVLGVNPIKVFRGNVPNAAATIINNTPVIVYNADFMNQLSAFNFYAPYSVLGHEVGHHVNFDLTFYGQFQHPWTKELRADYVSGVAMRRLGVSLSNALSACYALYTAEGSSSHPDSPKRIDAVTLGWYNGQ
jgi:hypothetical protein